VRQFHAECALIENPIDLFYLTGMKFSRGSLVVTRREMVLFLDGRYLGKAQKDLTIRVMPIEQMNDWIGKREVEIDGAVTTVDRFETLKKGLNIKVRSGLLKQQRAIKEKGEIEALKRAQDVTRSGFEHVQGQLREGVSEEELGWQFEMFVRKAGASGLSFESIVAFGENSAYPHYRAGKTRWKKGQIVLFDLGAVVDGYAGDMTRVVGASGELEKMLHWTIMAQQKAMETIRVGNTFGDLDRAARKVFQEMGVEELFTHSLGHGIGLETHEFPLIKITSADRDVKIEEGMVFTIEPGLYKPGLGGVRWEDVFVATNDGYVKL
jgi:Xaa-Pro aminopeptidase